MNKKESIFKKIQQLDDSFNVVENYQNYQLNDTQKNYLLM